MANCGNCKFAKTRTIPKEYLEEPKKPVAKERRFLFFKWTEEPDWVEAIGYSHDKSWYDYYHETVRCRLNPKQVDKRKTSWCSHHKPKDPLEAI